MAGLGEFVLGSVPIAGGAVLGALAGNLTGQGKTHDLREQINRDLDLIDRLPEEDTERRAALQQSVNARVDELIAGVDRRDSLHDAALSYRGNWRDIVIAVCVIMLTIAWWNEDHMRAQWLPTFVVLVLLCVLAVTYAAVGMTRAAKSVVRRN